jgi:hypothetical protein
MTKTPRTPLATPNTKLKSWEDAFISALVQSACTPFGLAIQSKEP